MCAMQQLEDQLQEQQDGQPDEPQKQLTQAPTEQRSNCPAASEASTSADLPEQGNSLAECAAGLLAMTSTADRAEHIQVKTAPSCSTHPDWTRFAA